MKKRLKFAIEYVGEIIILMGGVLKRMPQIIRSRHLLAEQIYTMGVGSLPIIGITFFFTGAVTAYQAAYQGAAYLPDIYVGMSTAKALLITLGALLTGLMLAGRIGSAMAAEIGTMRVTEQIDALETMAIDPIRYLVLPRFVACLIITPALTLVADIIGCIGGLACAVSILDIKANIFIQGLRTNFIPHEFWGSLLKAFTFGWWIAIMSCHHGLKTQGGAEGVGKSATRAVVSSSIMILAFEFIIAQIVF